MIDEGGVVYMLLAAQHVGAVEAAFDMTAADMGAQLVARQPAADAQHEAVVDGVVGEAGLAGGEVIGVRPLVLQLVVTEYGTTPDGNFGHAVREVDALADMALDHRRLAAGTGEDQQARVEDERLVAGRSDGDDMERFPARLPLADAQDDAVGHEGCVDRQSTRLNSSHYCASRMP